MMRKIVVLALFLMTMVVSAQGDGAYQLREPSVEEYLAAFPAFNELDVNDAYLTLALYNTLFWRYPDFREVRFDLLSNASLMFRDDYSFPVTIFSDGLTQAGWNEWLINAWLRENPTAFDNADEIHFGDFTIAITRADLSGDGDNELLLDIREII
jgi:hypothetical protein